MEWKKKQKCKSPDLLRVELKMWLVVHRLSMVCTLHSGFCYLFVVILFKYAICNGRTCHGPSSSFFIDRFTEVEVLLHLLNLNVNFIKFGV